MTLRDLFRRRELSVSAEWLKAHARMEIVRSIQVEGPVWNWSYLRRRRKWLDRVEQARAKKQERAA